MRDLHERGEIMQQTMIDYIDWRADLSFDKAPQNEIDALILSEISYIPFDDIVPKGRENAITLKNASNMFFERNGENFSLGAIIPKEILVVLKKASATKRFSNVLVWGYESEISLDTETQFSAIAFSCSNKITYVVYRGTDDTIVGWKEDLNMALFTPIPSQELGAKYLEKIAGSTRDRLIISGHSKGGNIAIYSALMACSKTQKRIDRVYSFDGPGFEDDFISPFKNDKFTQRLLTVLPSKSVVGRIFDIIGDYKIVKSYDKGIQQHNAFTWAVLGTDFINEEKFEKPSDNFHELLSVWVSKMSSEERHDFVEAFYKMITSSDASTLTDITSKKFKFIMGILKSKGVHKKVIIDAVFKLIKEKNAMNSAEKRAKKIAKKNAKGGD